MGDWLHWIRRNLNTEADALANWALDHECDEVRVNWPAVRRFYEALAWDATPQIRGYCDGACRGNPGKSSIGLALYMYVRGDTCLLARAGIRIGYATSTVAEAAALFALIALFCQLLQKR
eukprot:2466476-Lingulodinium_polyedra.AAC.1